MLELYNMHLIIGLGNPGEKYKETRHNMGFAALEELQRKNNFPDFRFSKKFNAEISEGSLDKERIILAKPQTFMNSSGKSAKPLLNFYKASKTFLAVIHDDIDLPLGRMRIVENRSSAGHKGVESIIKELRTKNFVRFRLGICPKAGKPKNPEKFVLQKFNKEEKNIAKEVMKKTAEAVGMTTKEGIEKAMSSYNK